MSSSPLTKAPAVFVCDCAQWARSACEGLPFFKEHAGRPYCVLHYPGTDKVAKLSEVFERKLDARDFNFRAAWFPEGVDFSNFTFAAPRHRCGAGGRDAGDGSRAGAGGAARAGHPAEVHAVKPSRRPLPRTERVRIWIDFAPGFGIRFRATGKRGWAAVEF
jgi:hypothetical protein